MAADSRSGKKNTTQTPSSSAINGILIAVFVVVGVGVFAYALASGYFTSTGLVAGPALATNTNVLPNPNAGDPSQYLSRQSYFEEAFRPSREEYAIFEKAAAHSGKPLASMPQFFSLKDEVAIFSALPPIPQNFGEIAYFLASGSFFAIGGLSEGYWKQPEFYPGFKENGLRYWTQPDPTSWAPNGYGTYPAEQWATLKVGETEQFEATIFLYSGYGVQTYQGVSLFPDSEANAYFDIEATPNTFLLEPNFPAFQSEWVKKITIRGTLKPNAPKGEHTIAINVGFPPEDKRKEWALKYLNLYQDGAAGARPSGNQITLHVLVE